MLLIKCLKEEIKAYLTYSDKKEAVKNKEMARDWLFDDDYESGNEFSCPRICKALGKDINTMRLNVLFAEKKQWSLDEYMQYTLYGVAPKEKDDGKDRQK